VSHFQGTEVEVEATPELPLELDGDPIGATPARFSLEPGALRLIVPA
jgi:diacylglycerol kinase family enzyme